MLNFMFPGGSSGAAMYAAMRFAKDLREDQVCVVICPDNIRNYMTKFVVDNWLEARNLKESENVHCHPWWNRKVYEIINDVIAPQQTYKSSATCQEIIDNLKKQNIEQIAIVDEEGELLGIATIMNLMNKILDRSLNASDPISKHLFKKFVKINDETTVGRLSRILEKESYVVVVGKYEKAQNGKTNGTNGSLNGTHGTNGSSNGSDRTNGNLNRSNGTNGSFNGKNGTNGSLNGTNGSNGHQNSEISIITQKDFMKFLPTPQEN